MSFETFHKVLEFANGKSWFLERAVFIGVTELQGGKYSLHGSQLESPHSAKMQYIPDPWLAGMWIALRVASVSRRPIKHRLFSRSDPSDVRMNDLLGCCRTGSSTKTR